MKKGTPWFLVVSAVVFSTFFYLRTIHRERSRAAEAERQSQQAAAGAAQKEEENRSLERELQRTATESAARAHEAQELKQKLASSTDPTNAPGPAPGAKLFKDPQMKAMMKKQQMENVGQMADKILDNDFIARLGLSPEQTGYLKELLKKKYGPGADLTIELMAGELNDAQLAELGRQFKQQMAQADGQIKSFLGEDAYKTFEWQEKSQEERSQVKELQKKLTGQGQSLSPEQENGLLSAMYEERRNYKFKIDYSDPLNYDYEHLHEFFADENFERFFQEMEELNRTIMQRAQVILTPEQSAEFNTMQQDKLEKGKVVVRMTNALFGQRR